jgi:hypothetical protein
MMICENFPALFNKQAAHLIIKLKWVKRREYITSAPRINNLKAILFA